MNIYLAGSISKDDWRSLVVDGYSCDDLISEESEFPVLNNAILGKHNYMGPYRVLRHGRGYSKHWEHDKHGFNQMGGECWGMNKIYKSCLKAITNSDLIIAVINSLDCYGTLFELGYARALNKPIYIITTLFDTEVEGINQNCFTDDSISQYSLGDVELWFTFMSADKVYNSSRLDIKKAMKKLLNIEERIDYKAYLQSEQWKLIRDTALELYGNKCILCDSTDNLNVHHKTYKNIGNEDIDDLIVLCKRCHMKHHKL